MQPYGNSAAPQHPHDRQISRLAFLAADLQALILEGHQPPGLTLRKLLKSELPLAWDDQRDWFAMLGASQAQPLSPVFPLFSGETVRGLPRRRQARFGSQNCPQNGAPCT